MNTIFSRTRTLAVAGVIGASVFAVNAQAASVTGSASADVRTPIAITAGAAMNFGNIAVGAIGGTAVVDTADALSVTGDVSGLSGVVPASGAFSVTGQGTSTYSITLPTTIALTSGANTMTVSALNHNAGLTPALAAGAATFKVGGTLTAAGGQATGTYTGSYSVVVNYN